MANSWKIVPSLWKMSTLLLSLCVFFADQTACFSITSRSNAESSQLRPGLNSLEVPGGDAESPAAESLQSRSSRTRRDSGDCPPNKLFNLRHCKFLAVFGDSGAARGVESVGEITNLRLESERFGLVQLNFSNGLIGVNNDNTITTYSRGDQNLDNHTQWCEFGTKEVGFQFKYFGPNSSNCKQTTSYLKMDGNGDVSISNNQNGTYFYKFYL